jgi:hypothetical protein
MEKDETGQRAVIDLEITGDATKTLLGQKNRVNHGAELINF